MTRSIWGILLVLATSACGSDDPSGPAAASLAGTYTAKSMTVTFGETTVTMGPPEATGALTLTESRYSVTITFSLPSLGLDSSVSEAGTYDVSGTTITFDPDGPESAYSLQISADRQRITFSSTVTEGGQTQSTTIVFVRA